MLYSKVNKAWKTYKFARLSIFFFSFFPIFHFPNSISIKSFVETLNCFIKHFVKNEFFQTKLLHAACPGELDLQNTRLD